MNEIRDNARVYLLGMGETFAGLHHLVLHKKIFGSAGSALLPAIYQVIERIDFALVVLEESTEDSIHVMILDIFDLVGATMEQVSQMRQAQ